MSPEVKQYYAEFPPATRARLRAMRAAIMSVAPRVEESITYRIPTFKLDGRPFVYYAAFKNHTSLYPMTDAIRRAFATELKGYKTSKGTVQFPLDEPLPGALVKRLVKAKLTELRAKMKPKAKSKSK